MLTLAKRMFETGKWMDKKGCEVLCQKFLHVNLVAQSCELFMNMEIMYRCVGMQCNSDACLLVCC